MCADGEQRTLGQGVEGEYSTGIREPAGTGCRRDSPVGPERVRRARRAVLRRLQVADEIVVLERRCGEEKDMETQSHERDERQTTTRSAQHPSMIRATQTESKRAHGVRFSGDRRAGR